MNYMVVCARTSANNQKNRNIHKYIDRYLYTCVLDQFLFCPHTQPIRHCQYNVQIVYAGVARVNSEAKAVSHTSNLDRHLKRKVHWTLGFVFILFYFFLLPFLFLFCSLYACTELCCSALNMLILFVKLACYQWSVLSFRFVCVCGMPMPYAVCNTWSMQQFPILLLFHSSCRYMYATHRYTYVLIIYYYCMTCRH